MFGRAKDSQSRSGPRARESRLDVTLRDRVVPVVVRRNPRARRIILRLDADGTGAVVTIPARAAVDDGLALVRRQADWLLARLDRAPTRMPFADGAVVPYLGCDHVIRHAPGRRRPVARDGADIVVAGGAEHLARRVGDWFRAEAKRILTARVDAKVEALGVKRGRITVRDTRSRWGSCAVGGNLSFSWRLVMAPDPVLDYVVAHEVAHLRHHDHGPAFWRAVATLTEHTESAKAWLASAGTRLHLYG